MKSNLLILLLGILVIQSCGTVKSDSTHAEVVPAPLAGYTCFVLKNEAGNAVGGNCLKN